MTFPFRSRTLAVLIRAIDAGYSHAKIGTLILEAEADQWQTTEPSNKEKRLQLLFQNMRNDGGQEAASAALELARLVLQHGADRLGLPPWYSSVKDAVASDGWEFDEGHDTLVPTVPGVEVAQETSFLEDDMSNRGWGTAAGHYRQALDALADGKWASTNGQLRSMFEDLVPSIAEAVSGKRPKEIQGCLDQLRKHGLLIDGEHGFAKGLWDMCQSRGPHAGLSDEAEARFRLMTVTSYSRFLIERLPS